MPTPGDPPSQDPDSLAGSPELFATNLLLVRAIDNDIERIEITRDETKITVQLFRDDREYERETLTEDTTTWDDIVDRFRDQTEFDTDENAGELKPSIPSVKTIDGIHASYTNNSIDLHFNY